jgi:hypothetical protein
MSVVVVSSYIKKRGAWLAYSGERREPGPQERANTREIDTTHDLTGSAAPHGLKLQRDRPDELGCRQV